jgi:hypothetical protein
MEDRMPGNAVMARRREFIERTRREKFGIGVEGTPETLNALKNLRAGYHRAVEKLARDLNSKDLHFVLELVQNADDNEYVNTIPMLRFRIRSDKVIVENNERGFNDREVDAICDVGNSTKSRSKGFIGEKGIGFKSVFQVSSRPTVVSNGFQFYFCDTEDANELGYIVPHWLADIPECIDKSLTSIVLPIRPEKRRKVEQLSQLKPELLLFLNKLRTIEVAYETEERLIRFSRADENGQIILTRDETQVGNWVLVSKSLPVPVATRTGDRTDVKETEVVLAFPLTTEGKADAGVVWDVFAFLPTRRYGFRYVVQADFVLSAARESIKEDNEWNQWLVAEMVGVFEEAIAKFRQHDTLALSYYDFIPLPGELDDGLFAEVPEKILSTMTNLPCVLAESGKWRPPTEMLYVEEGDKIRDLLPNDMLDTHLGKEYLHAGLEARVETLEALGVERFAPEHLFACLADAEWLQRQTDDWLATLYEYLAQPSLRDCSTEVRNLPILRLENGSHVAASDNGEVFLPPDKTLRRYDFVRRLPFLRTKTLDVGADREAVLAWLKSLGIEKAGVDVVVEMFVLPLYENGGWKGRSIAERREHVDLAKEYFENHQRALAGTAGASRITTIADVWERLRRALRLRCRKLSSRGYQDCVPSETYLGKDFDTGVDLEQLFNGCVDALLVSRNYLAQKRLPRRKKRRPSAEEKGLHLRKWRDFLTTLGAAGLPRLVQRNGVVIDSDSYGQEHSTSVLRRSSPDILSIIGNGTSEQRRVLLALLDTHWETFGAETHWRDKYRYHGWKSRLMEADWFKAAKTVAWLEGTDGSFYSADALCLDTAEFRRVFGDSKPRLTYSPTNSNFAEEMGISTALTIDGVVARVGQLAATKHAGRSEFLSCFLWLQKELDKGQSRLSWGQKRKLAVYVPGVENEYFQLSEAVWTDPGGLLKGTRVSLEEHYGEAEKFFLHYADVNERPSGEDYCDRLDALSKQEPPRGWLAIVVFEIYRKMEEILADGASKDSSADWLDRVRCGLLLTHHGEFWANDDDVFVADVPWLFETFKRSDQIGFLDLPPGTFPQLDRLLRALEIRSISKAVRVRAPSYASPTVAPLLTTQVQRLMRLAQRYVYRGSFERFKELERIGAWNRFALATAKRVANLVVEYFVGEVSVEEKRPAYFDGDQFLFACPPSDEGLFAGLEVARQFPWADGLGDFLTASWTMDDGQLERFLEAKGLGAVPTLSTEEAVGIEESAGMVSGDASLSTIVEPTEDTTSTVRNEGDSDSRQSPQGTQVEALEGTAPETTMTEGGTPGSVSLSVHRTSPVGGAKQEYAGPSTDDSPASNWSPDVSPELVEARIDDGDVRLQAEGNGREQGDEEGVTRGEGKDRHRSGGSAGPRQNERGQDPETLKRIGRWGEEYVVHCLRYELSTLYGSAEIRDEDDGSGFAVLIDGRGCARVKWWNANQDEGIGHDLVLEIEGEQRLIEVKTTIDSERGEFDVSGRQWKEMQARRGTYYIYRVFDAGNVSARIVRLKDPVGLFMKGELDAAPVRIRC